MAAIDEIVSVSITANSTTPSRQGFGTPLVLAYHTRFVDSYRTYASLSEMADDGFTTYDDAYRMAAAIFAQDPSPEQVIVGRLPSAPSYSSVLTMSTAVEGQFVRFTVIEPATGIEEDIEYEIPAAASLTSVGAAVEALIDAVDVDSIKTNVASSASPQTFTAGDFNGVIGDDTMANPRHITFTISSHADWDATNITLIGYDFAGTSRTETLAIPNGGNATLVSTHLYRSVTSVAIPAQSGAGGTATIGTKSGMTATNSSGAVTVVPAVAGRRVHIYDLENCTIEENTADAGYDTELTALQLVNDDWYFVLIDSSSPANVADVAAWTLGQKKMFFCATNSSGELGGTGTLGYDLSQLSNDRTVILYAPNSHEFAGAAWVGLGAAKDPGSITWAFKTLLGVTPKQLTSTQRTNLETDNINHYQTIAAVKITRPGKTAEGEWIDIRHGIDALEARIKEDVFALLAGADKVPFTTTGLDLIANAILGAMGAFEGTAEQPGLLEAGTSRVIMPALSSISASDKSNRRLTGVRFSANLSGAVHYVSIVGTLSNA